MYIIGRGRYAREGYPESGQGGSATVAARNRSVSQLTTVSETFTPGTAPSGSLVAAILFTPKVSGNVQVATNLTLSNGAASDTYQSTAIAIIGTGLSVSGGSDTSNGWVMGLNTPPVVGGTPTSGLELGVASEAVAAGEQGALSTFGMTPTPLAVGVPVVIEVIVAETGGGHDLAEIIFVQLSIVEQP